MVDFELTGAVLTRQGARHPAAGDGLYACADGWVVLAGGTWDALAAWAAGESPGAAVDLTDRRWRDGRRRAEETETLDAVLEPWLRRRTRETLYAEALRRDVMLAPVRRPEELFDDPQLRARDYFRRLEGVPAVLPGPPYRLSATPWALRSATPRLGANNAAIYGGALGLTARERAALRANGAI
jgi:benzylsuccinate CoA-transferase BbsE subunit